MSAITIPALDLALLIGLIMQFTKLADTVLRPHQQRWLQEQVEVLALHLEELRPLKWYKRALTNRTVLALTVAANIVAIGYVVLLAPDVFTRKFEGRSTASLTIMLLLIALPTALGLWRYEPTLRGWFHSEGRFATFLRRYILFSVSAALAVAALLTLVDVYFMVIPAPRSRLLLALQLLPALALMVPAFGLMGIWLVETFTAYLVVLLQIGLTVVSLMIRAICGIVWRIAEYNKGAWAALTLIATVALGVARIWLGVKD